MSLSNQVSIQFGSYLEQSWANWFASRAYRLENNYESFTNTVRGVRSLAVYVIEMGGYVTPVANRVLSLLGEAFNFAAEKQDFAFLGSLRPFESAVKQGQDFLNFFDVFLRIHKICDRTVWDKDKTQRIKLLSMLIQVPQKALDSFLMTDSLKIIDLARFCKNVGVWCTNKFGEHWAWSYITKGALCNVKEGLTLLSSFLSLFSYFNQVKSDSAMLRRKGIRSIAINQLRDAVGKDGFFETLDKFNQASPPERPHRHTLKHLEERMLKFFAKSTEDKVFQEEKEKAVNRYFRKLILTSDRPGSPAVINQYFPKDIVHRFNRILTIIPTPEERLRRVITYKDKKCAVQPDFIKLEIKKNTISFWFEVSKTIIVSLGLILSFFASASIVCALSPIVSPMLLCSAISVLEFGRWNSLLFIGVTGLVRTGYLAFYYDTYKEAFKKRTPNIQDVFVIRP